MEINSNHSTYGAAFRQKPIFFMSGKETVASVSYTHLDVYKRQDGRFRLCQELRITVFYFKQHLEHQKQIWSTIFSCPK